MRDYFFSRGSLLLRCTGRLLRDVGRADETEAGLFFDCGLPDLRLGLLDLRLGLFRRPRGERDRERDLRLGLLDLRLGLLDLRLGLFRCTRGERDRDRDLRLGLLDLFHRLRGERDRDRDLRLAEGLSFSWAADDDDTVCEESSGSGMRNVVPRGNSFSVTTSFAASSVLKALINSTIPFPPRTTHWPT